MVAIFKKILGLYYDASTDATPSPFANTATKVLPAHNEEIRETSMLHIPNKHTDTEDGFHATIGRSKKVVAVNETKQRELVSEAGLNWESFVKIRAYYLLGFTAEETERMFYDPGKKKAKRGFGIRTIEKMWPILTGSAIDHNKNRNLSKFRKLKLKIKRL